MDGVIWAGKLLQLRYADRGKKKKRKKKGPSVHAGAPVNCLHKKSAK